MKEYPVRSTKTGKTEMKSLDSNHLYALPFTEFNYRIPLDPQGDDKTIIGGEFLKIRMIVEQSLSKIRLFPTKKRLQKRELQVAENHTQVEKIMKIQGIMMEIHDRIINAMRQIYKQEKNPDVRRAGLRKKIDQMDIPGILLANNLDISMARGYTHSAYLGFQIGFGGEAIYEVIGIEDEEGDIFLKNARL